MKNFALIGAAGFVAPRHMAAIHDVKGNLVAALDRSDSVGVLDRYFPDAHFFTEFERFDRFVYNQKSNINLETINYMSVCSPNYLHDSHIRFGLRSGADVICEKPIVLNPHNLDKLITIEKDLGGTVNCILQLRLHPEIIRLKSELDVGANDFKYDVDLTYITSRGRWYNESWKGDEGKSGGVATNIGVHFFDLLAYLFGDLQTNTLHKKSLNTNAGYLEYERARVRWFLSTDKEYLPSEVARDNKTTFRSITINGEQVELSRGFDNLHTKSYEEVLSGKGFRLEDARASIEVVSQIRNMDVTQKFGEYHPMLSERVSL